MNINGQIIDDRDAKFIRKWGSQFGFSPEEALKRLCRELDSSYGGNDISTRIENGHIVDLNLFDCKAEYKSNYGIPGLYYLSHLEVLNLGKSFLEGELDLSSNQKLRHFRFYNFAWKKPFEINIVQNRNLEKISGVMNFRQSDFYCTEEQKRKFFKGKRIGVKVIPESPVKRHNRLAKYNWDEGVLSTQMDHQTTRYRCWNGSYGLLDGRRRLLCSILEDGRCTSCKY